MHEKGLGGEINHAEAISLYDRAIELGCATAMNNRALMHEKGLGGEINYAEAISLYDRAIELKNAAAMNNRAIMHHAGLGGEINYAEAISLYDRAIKLVGYAATMYNRAIMHEKGLGGEINYAQAISLYDRAIKLGCAAAMYNRALMHEKGLGGEINYAEAISLYDRAIELGYAAAKKRRANIPKRPQDRYRYSVEKTLFPKLIDEGEKLTEQEIKLCIKYKEVLKEQLFAQYTEDLITLENAIDKNKPLGKIFWTQRSRFRIFQSSVPLTVISIQEKITQLNNQLQLPPGGLSIQMDSLVR
jgi:TPR repeat protein